ncbi:hypothetical protein PYW07_003379 [Mythimna separata]|uniref:Uncharacterized protein n=1 Tax=Mythimna separata TaxID=271217 RepID=A0AAD7YI06_MYTSE|nr:hypothetical protein PYW07_003379 [Mythimna separata]
MSLKRIFIFALLCVSSVLCEKQPCDMDDNECLTESANLIYEQFASGMPGVEPSDPLHLDLFEFNVPTLSYKLTNGTLTGMKDCHIDFIQMSKNTKKYHSHIRCPFLVFKAKYEVKGNVGSEFVEGKGDCRIFMFDYYLLFNGDFDKKDCNDKKIHYQLKNTNLEIEAKGRVYYDFENLFKGDNAKSEAVHQFINRYWQYVDKLIRQPGMEAFMKIFIDNVNAYMRKISYNELFTY